MKKSELIALLEAIDGDPDIAVVKEETTGNVLLSFPKKEVDKYDLRVFLNYLHRLIRFEAESRFSRGWGVFTRAERKNLSFSRVHDALEALAPPEPGCTCMASPENCKIHREE